MLKGIGLAATLVALLFLSGCLQEMSIAERHACIDLSSRAYAYVPACYTEEECFNAVQQEFFSFDERVFSPRIQEELYAFKNRLALSWLYFNDAGKSAETIRNICSSKQNTSELPFHVNELNHSLRIAFQHSDSAFEKAFSVILLEEQSLQTDEIELINEEPLFDSYIALNNNLNDLESSNASTETFAGYYLQQTASLQELVEKTGFSQRILMEKSLLDLVEPRAEQLSDEAQRRAELRIPFLSDAMGGFVAYLNSVLKIRQAALALPEFPSFEFFQVYNNLCGKENSAAKKFSQLLGNDAKNRALLIQRNDEMEQQLQNSFSIIEQGVEELSPKAYGSIDQNIFSSLYSLLGKSSSIAVQRFGIQNLSEFKEKAVAELNELKTDFSLLKREEFLDEISLGRKTLKLKELLASSAILSENIEYLSIEIVEGALLLCEERINQIDSWLNEIDAPSEAVLSVADLKSRINFKIAGFREASEEGKILLCKDILVEYTSLQSALQDFYSFEAGLFFSFEGCMQRVEAILSAEDSMQFGLSDFKARLNSIKAIAITSENIQMIDRYCTTLGRDLDLFLQQSSSAKNLLQKYAACKALLQKIESMGSRFPESVSMKTIEGFSSKLSLLGKYFTQRSVNFAEALPVLAELEMQLDSLEKDMNSTAAEAANHIISKNFSVAVLSESIPVLGEPSKATVRVLLENPFDFDLLGFQTIELPLDAKVEGIAQASPNVLSVNHDGETLLVSLSGLPQGFTLIDLNSVIETSFEESLQLLSVDQFQAVFEKTISIKTAGAIPKLFAEIKLLPGSSLSTSNVRVYHAQKSIPFSKEGNVVSLVLEGVRNGQNLLLYFSVEKPLEIETELLEKGKVTESSELYRFKVVVQNRLHVPLNKIRIKMPLNIEGNSVVVREFVDSSGKSIKFEVLSTKNIALWLESLPPGQKGYLYLLLEAKNPEQYWQQHLEEQKARAKSLTKSTSLQIMERAGELLGKLNSFQEKFFESKEQINELNSITQLLDKLEAESSSLFSSMQQFTSLKEELLKELSAIEEEAALFLALGFESEAAEKKNALQALQKSLQEAEKMFEEGKHKAAIEKIFETRAVLSQQPTKSVRDFLTKEKDLIVKQFGELTDKSRKAGLSADKGLEKEIFLMGSDVDSVIAAGNLVQSKEILNAMKEKVNSFGEGLDQKAREEAELVAERIKKLQQLVNSSLSSMLVQLSSIFSGVDEGEIVKAKYVSPTSLSRVKKAELEIEQLNSLFLNERFNQFLSLFEEGKYSDALTLAAQFSKELAEKEEKALALETELNNAIQQLKEDALASFNAAAQIFNRSGFNAAANEALEESEVSLKAGDFLKSIVQSKNAVALLSMPGQQQSFPLYLLPIFIAALLVFVVRFKRKKQDEIKSRKLERVLSAWRD